MSSSKSKELRSQLRTVVKEMLAEVVKEELFKLLERDILNRLGELEKFTKDTLHEINERHKSTMGYLVRTVTTNSK